MTPGTWSLAAPLSRNLRARRAHKPQRAVPGVPALSHLGVDVEGQDEEGEQQVGHGEADDEVVGGGLERPLRADAQTDEPVAADYEEDEEDAEHQGGDAVAGSGGRGSGGAVAHGPGRCPRSPAHGAGPAAGSCPPSRGRSLRRRRPARLPGDNWVTTKRLKGWRRGGQAPGVPAPGVLVSRALQRSCCVLTWSRCVLT